MIDNGSERITDDAGYQRVQSRVRQLMGNCADEAELQELKFLAKELERYSMQRFEINQTRTDGVHHIEFLLDQGAATLEGLVEVFGGRQQLVDYMTRRRNIKDQTIDAIVSNFHTKREFIDRPFCRPAGWEYDARPGDAEWYADLTEMVRSAEPQLAVAGV